MAYLLWLVRKAAGTLALGSSGLVSCSERAVSWARTLHSGHSGCDDWHYLGPLELSEIFHFHFVLTEEFPAQASCSCSGLLRYAKQRPPTPAAVADGTQLAALTLTQLSLPGNTQPLARAHRLGGLLLISHGESSTRLRSVSRVPTVGVWQEQETALCV